jgi:hypothetical protein
MRFGTLNFTVSTCLCSFEKVAIRSAKYMSHLVGVQDVRSRKAGTQTPLLKLTSCSTTRQEGVWVERRYSSYSFSTSALDGGGWSTSHSSRALAPKKGLPVPIVQEAGWAPALIWTQRPEEKSFRFCQGSNLDHPVVQPIARHYTDWATLVQNQHFWWT